MYRPTFLDRFWHWMGVAFLVWMIGGTIIIEFLRLIGSSLVSPAPHEAKPWYADPRVCQQYPKECRQAQEDDRLEEWRAE